MRVFAFALLLVGFLGLASAALNLDGIPSCAVSCMIKALPQSTCAATDQTCLCVDPKFNAAVQPCIQQTCTIKESLIITNATWSQCNFPLTDQTAKIHWIGGVVTFITVAFMVMRLVSKAMKLSTWGADDTAIVIAFALFIGFYVELFYFVRAGLGKDIWTLHDYEITYFLKLLFALEFFYFIGLASIKASILFLFLKIFPSKGFRKVLWVMQLLSALVGLSFVILCFAECQPLSHFWDGWSGENQGTCLDLNRIGLSHVALNITLDIVMLILPITQIYNLKMDKRKKLGVIAMFLVGVFLTVVSILRIKTLIVFATSLNTTADSVAVVLWAYVELGVGVIVACMPNVRQLLQTLPSKVVQLSTNMASAVGSSLSNSRTRVSVSQVYHEKPNKSFRDTHMTIGTDTTIAASEASLSPRGFD
ncbi:CFEM domain-containing protein [Colletotrichum karsti]|uniref:CFEM domain-containing protein n=1 Tax=Colletotrichum karsti TaxID=1095194 RepID=A0A9P6I1E3_9PEZI|nr:CFEM domain-containing protein [Colletotrichum karsti]KAF9873071.1 CFEM domain-containing protein [Colletotrichum karsti]